MLREANLFAHIDYDYLQSTTTQAAISSRPPLWISRGNC